VSIRPKGSLELVGKFFEVRAQVDRDLTTVSRVDRRLGLIKNLGRHKAGMASLSRGCKSMAMGTYRLLPWQIWTRTTGVHGAPVVVARTCPWPCSPAAAAERLHPCSRGSGGSSLSQSSPPPRAATTSHICAPEVAEAGTGAKEHTGKCLSDITNSMEVVLKVQLLPFLLRSSFPLPLPP
jgi:hypothetical protein